jgi:hypothetical protein
MEVAMSKQEVLVVADRTADSPELIEGLRRRGAASSAQVTLLVPATPRRLRRESQLETWTSALERAESGVAAIRAAGIDCSGAIVADPDPVLAAGDVLHARRFDEVLVAAPPPGLWALLRPSLVERLRRHTDLPVAELTIHPLEGGPPLSSRRAPTGRPRIGAAS